MKTDIHPNYFPEATVQCACGNIFTTGSTLESMRVEICSHCHPFYTGKQKLIDTARRVEKFQAKVAKASALKTKRASRKTQVKTDETSQTLKSRTVKLTHTRDLQSLKKQVTKETKTLGTKKSKLQEKTQPTKQDQSEA